MKNSLTPKLFIVLMLWFGLAVNAQARQQNFSFEQIDEKFAQVVEALGENDHKAAEQSLKELHSELGDTADYHFLEGIVTVLSMNDASALRLPFLARRMRNQWNEALEKDPNHELAHLSLLQFHANAPGIAGGDKEQATAHAQRLRELNSPLRFQADIVLAAVSGDFTDEEAAWEAWFNDQPNNLDIRFNYILQRINSEHFDKALIQIQHIVENANADNDADYELLSQVYYQWGKLAAESGKDLENGASALERILAENRVPDAVPPGWPHYRLAQIYHQQNRIEEANAMRAEATLLAKDDKNLREALSNLSS
ncbi:hypothetical protein CWE08_01410 [Aliidiomarina iranensis]|uniref:Tetratricopeptide repeat-like domain-containing protein n=1 Tax=Aliidiomarina iranensis TaxID=1434071 RepID=A0A432W295_9GAMM|nr:hypothetical protein [Aliidiomarina iranensis]RUO23334.1 hypothetical protein CWE08_01410 [Aliidiomarina iranensis]